MLTSASEEYSVSILKAEVVSWHIEELYVKADESGQWEQVHWSVSTVQDRGNGPSQDMPSELTVSFKSQFYDLISVPGAPNFCSCQFFHAQP
jgi:hypothetical protein